MPDPRFKPPSSEPRDPPRGKGSAVRGVLLGLLVDLGGTTLFSLLLSLVYSGFLAAGGRSPEQIAEVIAHSEDDPVLSGIALVGGLAFSVLGGFVCERVARQGNYKLGIVLCCISSGLGLLLGWSVTSVPMSLLLVFLGVGSVLLGTRLGFEVR